jgi:hypothetical protein
MGFINFRAPLGNFEIIRQSEGNNANTILSSAIASTGHYVGANWIAPKTGNITSIGVLLTALSGSLPTTNIVLEGVNTSKGADNIAAATTGLITSVTSGFVWIPFPSTQVKEGSGYSCVIRSTGTVSSTNCGFFGYSNNPSSVNANGYLNNFPIRFVGSLSTPIGYSMIVPRYSDGSIPQGFYIANTGNVPYGGATFSSGTSLPLKGLLFQTPFECKLSSFLIATAQVSSQSHTEVRLYDSANALLFRREFAANKNWTGNQGCLLVELASGIIVKKNTNYRLILNPSGTAALSNYFNTMNSTGDLQNFYGFSGCMTEGSGTGSSLAWKNYNNSTDGFRAWIAMPILSDIAIAGRRRGTGA